MLPAVRRRDPAARSDALRVALRPLRRGRAAPLAAGHLGRGRRQRRASGPPVTERRGLPLWCPWPLLPGWTVTGVAWAGDEPDRPAGDGAGAVRPGAAVGRAGRHRLRRRGPRRRPRQLPGRPGRHRSGRSRCGRRHENMAPHAKVKAAGHPTPLWAVELGDRPQRVRRRGPGLLAVRDHLARPGRLPAGGGHPAARPGRVGAERARVRRAVCATSPGASKGVISRRGLPSAGLRGRD